MDTLDAPPLAVDTMTDAQLARRRRITEAVIDLVADVGPEAFQMKDVTARSGVALKTLYRYFASKDHLMAAAVADWHDRLVRQVAADAARRPGAAAPEEDRPDVRVLRFSLRGLRAFQRHPNFARLVVSLVASPDPYASETIAEMDAASARAMRAIMHDVPAPLADTVQVAVQSVLIAGLTAWVTGRTTWPELVRDLEAVIVRLLRD
ncbi:TetR/AcrR family transcriptional regulator [Yinghuangia soli]|uniref:TetR family transcriptional regulator n=1 Tax=Yinghuangia soli TaxID=2908204 RepID=A0AA41U1E1_9ACTN|nr:TetR/AcrR family transcriptional regulator [Yinghuangia soli]MCF2530698.1 TetR family transcriptional regulator [Yinghuangia soli]